MRFFLLGKRPDFFHCCENNVPSGVSGVIHSLYIGELSRQIWIRYNSFLKNRKKSAQVLSTHKLTPYSVELYRGIYSVYWSSYYSYSVLIPRPVGEFAEAPGKGASHVVQMYQRERVLVENLTLYGVLSTRTVLASTQYE